jgi:hypothetical protein
MGFAISLRPSLVNLNVFSMVEQPPTKSMIVRMIVLVFSIGHVKALQVGAFDPEHLISNTF